LYLVPLLIFIFGSGPFNLVTGHLKQNITKFSISHVATSPSISHKWDRNQLLQLKRPK